LLRLCKLSIVNVVLFRVSLCNLQRCEGGDRGRRHGRNPGGGHPKLWIIRRLEITKPVFINIRHHQCFYNPNSDLPRRQRILDRALQMAPPTFLLLNTPANRLKRLLYIQQTIHYKRCCKFTGISGILGITGIASILQGNCGRLGILRNCQTSQRVASFVLRVSGVAFYP